MVKGHILEFDDLVILRPGTGVSPMELELNYGSEFLKVHDVIVKKLNENKNQIETHHNKDQNIAAIDPNFAGCGRCLTENNGAYEFITIQPGPYPYPNRGVEWRPMHIHFSIFGKSFGQRLITQMYFEGDPLIEFCPMVNSIPDKKAKKSLIGFLDKTQSNTKQLLAYKFDIILRGSNQTFFENKTEGL